IPEGFSAAATSFAEADNTASQAKVTLEFSETDQHDQTSLAELIAEQASRVLGAQLTSTYLENVLLGFGDMGGQIGDAADAADHLAVGADALAAGVQQLNSGAAALQDAAKTLNGHTTAAAQDSVTSAANLGAIAN